MLSCLSVGISAYKNKNLVSIPCARNDAREIYDAFQQIMGEEFNQYLSLCVSDIRSEDFKALLSVISDVISNSSIQSEQVFVVYFSGHGAINENSLELRFPEYGRNIRHDDLFLVNRIPDFFQTQKMKVLIILDCCNSGAALPFANRDDQGSEISVLASVNSYGSAKFNENGSVFTKILCKSIHEIHRSGEAFSFNSLINKIKSNGYSDFFVHRGAGQELDISFRGQQTIDGIDPFFSEHFLERIAQGNILSREALWYSLNDFPDKSVLETSTRYFNVDGIFGRGLSQEASWLVRRAIGSTLANHASNPDILSLLEKLLESQYWQEQCVALIGLRYYIRTDRGICNHIIDLVKRKKIKRIDAVWLASLYVSDNQMTDWKIFLDTTLALTPWGMIELCKAFNLFETGLNNETLTKHKFYNELTLENKRRTKNGNTILEQYVYSGNHRGRLPTNSKVKFLLSALYGNWRDQIKLNLRPYFECTDPSQAEFELQEFSKVCNAERKMALFAYLNESLEEAVPYRDSLEWGLFDDHPWVRRTAIEFFQKLGTSNTILRKSYHSARFDDGYPGLLDFYLTCPISLQQELISHLKTESILLKGDIQSLEQSFSLSNT